MSFHLHHLATARGPGWVITLRSSGDFVVVNQSESGINSLLAPHEGPTGETFVHLGQWNERPIWMCLDDDTAAESTSLRSLADSFTPHEFSLSARALQLLHWRQMHRFCGRCGLATERSATELCLLCTNCGGTYYPRISPCVIGLVSRGDELLLACHHRHKAGRYSLLAGFIEVGESAEGAFAREVFEEVGIRVKNLRYISSQPWPYPSQLMLGFFAEYASGEIEVDESEIQHAAWFHPERLPDVPSGVSIAGKLINAFLAERGFSSHREV